MFYLTGALLLLSLINPAAFLAIMGIAALSLLALKLYFMSQQEAPKSGREQQP